MKRCSSVVDHFTDCTHFVWDVNVFFTKDPSVKSEEKHYLHTSKLQVNYKITFQKRTEITKFQIKEKFIKLTHQQI